MNHEFQVNDWAMIKFDTYPCRTRARMVRVKVLKVSKKSYLVEYENGSKKTVPKSKLEKDE